EGIPLRDAEDQPVGLRFRPRFRGPVQRRVAVFHGFGGVIGKRGRKGFRTPEPASARPPASGPTGRAGRRTPSPPAAGSSARSGRLPAAPAARSASPYRTAPGPPR